MRLLLIAMLAISCVPPPPPPSGPVQIENVARLDAAIHRAGTKLRELARSDGLFTYEYRVASGKSTGEYNIVRHAGAIYALAQFEQVDPDPATRDVIARTSDYLVKHAVRSVTDQVSAIFSMAAPGALEVDASLGATGLGVVALISADTLEPGSIPDDTLRALGNFLVYMQRPDGSFYSTWLQDGGRTAKFDSLYYPGEAILGLALLATHVHDDRYRDAALKGLRFLAVARQTSRDVPSDNWALVATEQLIGPLAGADRVLLMHHADQIATVNLSTQILDSHSPIFGCYTDDGRTTPSSTHLEGLLAAASYLPRTDLRASIDAGIHFLIASQLADGAMPADQQQKLVRIDYIQHALSAFIRYKAMLAR